MHRSHSNYHILPKRWRQIKTCTLQSAKACGKRSRLNPISCSTCQQEKSGIREEIPENDPTWLQIRSTEGLHLCWRHSGGSVLRWRWGECLSIKPQSISGFHSWNCAIRTIVLLRRLHRPCKHSGSKCAFRHSWSHFPSRWYSESKNWGKVKEISFISTGGMLAFLHYVHPRVKSPERPLSCCLIAREPNLRRLNVQLLRF